VMLLAGLGDDREPTQVKIKARRRTGGEHRKVIDQVLTRRKRDVGATPPAEARCDDPHVRILAPAPV